MAKFSAMVDLAKDPEEIKEDIAEMAPGPATRVAVYPYGMCIRMNEEVLEKLGLDGDLPEVGDMIHLQAIGKATSVSQNEEELADGTKKTCRNVEIQLTHVASLEDAEQDSTPKHVAGKWYGGEAA